ncbi:lamin-A-like [Lates calcarifer]|uniref:Lamin-A-like n=1 Tax=Lates calcarifer TaxID=8187 RepID=A0AAJ8B5C3_LATCA|nr:lamin-A-like [Lates calcarifer]
MQQNFRMFPLMNDLFLQSSVRPLSVLVFHLLLTHSQSQSQLIGPSQPIVATVGDDVILPCHLDPAEDVGTMILEWTRPDLKPIYVHMRRAGQDLVDKHPSYKGRTSLFINELKHGNISLKLSKVKLSDGGTYHCFIPKLDKRSSVELVVASGAASSPVISLSGTDSNRGAVVLECESKGWYPEPEVLWLDGEGNLLSAGPTETVRGPDDLYTVSSRVTVEKRHSNSFTCRVRQNKTNQTRETEIRIPDDFFKVQSSSSSVIIGLAVSLAVCIVVILSLVFCLWKKRQDKTRQKDSTRNKTEGGGEEMTPMRETVDGNTNHPQSGGRGASRSSFPPWRIISTQKLQEQQRRTQSLEEELQRRTQSLEQELQTKKEEVKDRGAEIQQLQDQNRDLQRLNRDLENKNKQLESQLSEEKKNRMEAERKMKEELQKTKTEMEKKLQDEQRRRMEAEKQLNSELKKERERREREVKSLEDQLQSKTKQVKDRGAEIQKLQDQNRDLQRLNQELQRLNQDLENKNKQSEVRGAEIQQLQDQNRDLQRLNQELENKNKQLERNQTAAEREEERLKDQTKQSSIIVDQIDPQGKYIHLRNQSDKDQPLRGWEIHVRVNKRKPIIWTFNHFDKVKAKNTVTIWTADSDHRYSIETDLKCRDLKSWSPEDHVLVTLFNCSGELEVSKEQGLENSQRTSQDSPSNRHITVGEVDQEGRYIRLYNSSYQDQPLGGWSIYVEVDNRKPIIYTFDYLRLRAGQTVTIWASDSHTRNRSSTDLVWSGQKSWGPGNQTVVTVFSSSGQEVTTKTFTAKHGS